jgi:hypothetical protein
MRKLPALTALLALAATAPSALVASAGTQDESAPQRNLAPVSVQSPQRVQRSLRLLAPRSRYLLPQIRRHRRATWHWQRVMAKRLTPAGRVQTTRVKSYRTWALRLWKRRHRKARRQASDPPHEAAWRCIHRYEGSWRDPGGPYYGGLQMDYGFMRRYGAFLLRKKGTADNWTPHEQMWVAERALRAGRGFYPWPNAARLCGLI